MRNLFFAALLSLVAAGCTCNKGPKQNELGITSTQMRDLLAGAKAADGGQCRAYQLVEDENGRHLECIELRPVDQSDGGQSTDAGAVR